MKKIVFILMFFISFTISGETNSMDAPSSFDSPYMCDGKKDHNFASIRNVHGKKLFVFDPRAHAWAAYNRDGKLIAVGKASGGASYCKDIQSECRTVTGSFRIYRKQGPECKSSAYPKRQGAPDGGAPMPYCMHFYRGYAIHGSSNVPNKNVSHGCIRVTPHCAEYLNKNFMEIGTRVLVLPYSSIGRKLWNIWETIDRFLI